MLSLIGTKRLFVVDDKSQDRKENCRRENKNHAKSRRYVLIVGVTNPAAERAISKGCCASSKKYSVNKIHLSLILP